MRNHQIIRVAFILFIGLFLFGCTSSSNIPTTYYYVLDANLESATVNVAANKSTERLVKILPVQVPDYMKQPNLVLKLQDHQIKIANYHFWAEDMRLSIQRVLLKDLNAKHNDISFSKRCSDCDELSIIIDQFYPTESGDVLLAGTVELRSQGNKLKRTDFNLKTTLNNGGYNEAVAKMRSLLTELSQQISL